MECGIMPLLCKQRALYVKGCVIANGVTDSQGDTLHAEDVKKIFTSFNNQDNFEIFHEEIPLKEVSLLENYISQTDECIGTAIVPAGSWNCVIRVDNPEIQEGLLTGELGGLSLNNRIAPRCKGNLTGVVRYNDVADAECVIPLLIYFVERGANGYGLHVYDYDAYIKKSKDVEFNENGGPIMDFKEFLNGLKSLIREAEDTPVEEEPAIEKEDEKTNEKVEEETIEVVEDETEEEPVVEKEEKTAEDESAPTEEEKEPVIEKEDEKVTETAEEAETTTDNTLEERVAKLEEIIAELTAVKETEETEETDEVLKDEVENADTPKITKSEKVIIENHPAPQVNYYEMTGRDPKTGKKIRK